MTPEEWIEIVAWIGERFPDTGWKAEQQVAYFDDLAAFDAQDVWVGILGYYEKGERFAPTGSQLVSRARDERRRSAQEDIYRALPEEAGEPTTWNQYTQRRFGEELTPMQVIQKLHADQPCTNEDCEIHYERVTNGTRSN